VYVCYVLEWGVCAQCIYSCVYYVYAKVCVLRFTVTVCVSYVYLYICVCFKNVELCVYIFVGVMCFMLCVLNICVCVVFNGVFMQWCCDVC